jgi:hypothetical protein
MARSIRVAVLAALPLAAVPAGAATATAGGTGLAAALQAGPAALTDFNGDGIDDLVVGVPGEDIGGTANAGVVDVIYGSESGLADGPRQQLTQALPEPGDGFGTAVVTGDFNGDILTDLAVGVPGENLGATADAGAVVVLAGPATHQLLTQGGATTIGSVPGATEAGDRFGSALGAADFDDNDADNLVVGVPGENLGAVADAGAVISLCGSDGQFEGCGDGVLTQGNPEAGDAYGAALTPGNFDGNEFPDLAVAAPGETVAGKANAGATDARDGGASGLPADPDEPLYYQGNAGVPGTAETGDQFAAALSA